jgi:hypothetical protein
VYLAPPGNLVRAILCGIGSIVARSCDPFVVAGMAAGVVLAGLAGATVGRASGRAGRLLNTCCRGVPTDSFLAACLPDSGGEWEWRQSTQLMHSVASPPAACSGVSLIPTLVRLPAGQGSPRPAAVGEAGLAWQCECATSSDGRFTVGKRHSIITRT